MLCRMIFAVLLVAAPALAAAQAYPSRAIKLVVNFPPGGGTDALARVLAADLQPLLGQPVVVENRPGANGNIGADYVAKSAPDGYTLIMVNSAFAISAGLYDKLPYDTIKDFTPVILFASVPSILAVPPSFPAKNLQELIGLLKANPGKYSYASCGAGSPQHMAAELFQSMTGTRMTHVPYKGCGPALTDVIGGHVPISFNTAANSVPHITSGKLKGIAATGKKRFPLVADVPTMEEGGLAGYDVERWSKLIKTLGLKVD
jgi:tripartite-type tricarboxylate transporter receptor subunit TctC